jgi:hypothetical protein
MAIPTEVLASTPENAGVSVRRSFSAWTSQCILVGIVSVIYIVNSLIAGHGQLVLPLDDVYIHFQYAHSIAAGHPYIYSPGFPPSSGATSFLYPYLLAVGDLIGFRGLNLGFWAMGIGALALLGAAWLVYLLARQIAPHWLSVYASGVFVLSGPISWHFMSGMETGLVVLLSLMVIYMMVVRNFRATLVAATLLVLMRPEGAILAGLAAILTPAPYNSSNKSPSTWLWRLLPIVAIGVQPMVNLLMTGSLVASGNAAKSVFGMIPTNPEVILGRILDNWGRMWLEFATGASPREGFYLPILIAPLAVIGVIALLFQQGAGRRIGLLLIGWYLAGTLAVSTLDTAFWHFKRYQIPFLALFCPLAAWGAVNLAHWIRRHKIKSVPKLRDFLFLGVGLYVFFTLILGTLQWQHYFSTNAAYIFQQPLQMASWLNANTPPDAVIAVHDTGLIPYLTQRPAIDIVGLTSAGAADSWRNGPGAVAEFLESSHPRPDYIAAYTDALGLRYLADTDLYGQPLASYPISVDNSLNVALAADFQGIYRPDWMAADRATAVMQPSTLAYINGFTLADSLDVADLASERAHNYRWNDGERLPGFPTEVYEMNYTACGIDNCHVLDGGRLINDEESFTLATQPGEDLILVTRLHPHDSGTFDVYVNGEQVATRWIPAIPGQWLEVTALIPARLVTDRTAIRIVPHTPGGHYMPYYHWAYQGTYAQTAPDESEATFENGAIVLVSHDASIDQNTHKLTLNVDWATNGGTQGDYKVFVHLYADANQPPVAQADERPGQGTLPPGNWLPGVIHETIEVDLSQVPPGQYRLAIGLYNPLTNERLAPSGGDTQNRLFLQTVEIR